MKYLARKKDGAILRENLDGTFSFIETSMYKPYKYSREVLSDAHFEEITKEDFPRMKQRGEEYFKNPNAFLQKEFIGETASKNEPPKEIRNALWMMHDYEDFDKVLHDSHGKYTVGDSVYNAWQIIHMIVKNNPEWFIEWIKKNEPDFSDFETNPNDCI